MPVLEQPPDVATSSQRFIFRDADWPMYMGFLKALGERHVRLTYDRGRMELMTLSHRHEHSRSLLGRFVEVLTEELNLPMRSSGGTTLNREDLDQGLEPDESYYIENEPLVREKDEINLDIDPPPDLAMEIEVSRSALNRMGIYAAMKVPEVWRYDGEKILVYQLGADGQYIRVERSPHFPFLPINEVEAFLKRRTEMDETSLVRAFRQWVREQIAKGWK